MSHHSHMLSGIVAAAATPIQDGRPHLKNLEVHLRQLAADGCSGVLLMGTTGEGPSLSLEERVEVIGAGREFAGEMMVMAGTGCANLPETISLTRRAFECGVDAVVVIPPFYFKSVSDEGLLAYYLAVLDEAVPDHGRLVLYHIPQVTGVTVSFELLEGLMARRDERVAGVKDSGGDVNHGRELCRLFPSLRVFVGDDKLLYQGLQFGGVGCITAGANLLAPLAADVYREFRHGERDIAERYQERLTAARLVLEEYKPFPASIKGLLGVRYGTEGWEVRPPLTAIRKVELAKLTERLMALDLPEEHFGWLAALR